MTDIPEVTEALAWARCLLTMTDDTECIRVVDDDDGPGCGECERQVLVALNSISDTIEKLTRERLWLARRLSLVDAPTPLSGAFNLNEQGEANVPLWLEVAEREAHR